MSPVAAGARNYDVNSRVRVYFAWGPPASWTVFQRLPGPGRTALRAQAGAQAASGRLTPAPGPGMGGALRFHQVLSDTSSPLRKLRTGLKQQRPLPGASSGQRSPAPDDGSSRPRPHLARHRCPAHPWTGPVTRCPKKAARVTVRGGPRGPRSGAGCWSRACFPRGGEGGRPHSGRSRRRAGSGHKTEPRFSETASRCLASPSLSFPACGAIRCGAFGIKMTRNGTCGFGAFASLRHWRFGSKGGRFLHHVFAAM